MNNNRPAFLRLFYRRPRARTHIQCVNNKSNIPKRNSRETLEEIRDILQVMSLTASLCSIVVNTSVVYSCYFELNDELVSVNDKLDTFVNRHKNN